MTLSAKSNTTIQTKAVQLNAMNPVSLARFYNEAIGLKVLKEENDYYALGTPNGDVLLEIFKTDLPYNQETTGLYHLALLLPTYEDLGTVLRHLLVKQVPLTGASNHGYSNALYLDDPEGNGIEIYWDKDESEWDIQPDGTIVGITEPMDAEAALDAARTSFDGMPDGTIMGHVHLHVDNMSEAAEFYTDVMGLGLKYNMFESANFFASENYHHHLGANIWKRGNLEKANRLAPGLRSVIWSGTEDDLKYIEDKLTAHNISFDKEADQLIFNDPAGIEHAVVKDR